MNEKRTGRCLYTEPGGTDRQVLYLLVLSMMAFLMGFPLLMMGLRLGALLMLISISLFIACMLFLLATLDVGFSICEKGIQPRLNGWYYLFKREKFIPFDQISDIEVSYKQIISKAKASVLPQFIFAFHFKKPFSYNWTTKQTYLVTYQRKEIYPEIIKALRQAMLLHKTRLFIHHEYNHGMPLDDAEILYKKVVNIPRKSLIMDLDCEFVATCRYSSISFLLGILIWLAFYKQQEIPLQGSLSTVLVLEIIIVSLIFLLTIGWHLWLNSIAKARNSQLNYYSSEGTKAIRIVEGRRESRWREENSDQLDSIGPSG